MKIAMLYICTGKYDIFWKDFYTSFEKKFIPEIEKHYFVFTDSNEIYLENENTNITKITQKNLGWPDNTLLRYEMFLRIKEKLLSFDYVFFFNSDLICVENISSEDFLPSINEKLVATIHPGYFDKKRKTFPYERNTASTAFIKKDSGIHYFAGGLNGGITKDFLKAAEIILNNILIDKKNNITAKWHDESHWNKYLESSKNIKILGPEYLHPESDRRNYKKIIMIRDKRKYFTYADVGKTNFLLPILALKKVRSSIQKIPLLQRSHFLQLLKRWLYRIRPLLTVYKNEKMSAIENYLKNDIEIREIKKEINKFKEGSIYKFDGAKLPLCVITPDTYLNVLKPHVEKICYDEISIKKFYQEQKTKYKTMHFLKDTGAGNEPDYVGGHIISHGFCYFLDSVIINKDDVVIDLGSAPGDFSAVCVDMGAAKVYAFEPEENSSSNLARVKYLNQNKISIVRKYSGAKTDQKTNCISLDDFVKENAVDRVDFIKADIEGAEINALLGAKYILKKFKPKLAFCTYHNATDEARIEKAILEGNPDYKIRKEKGIIYAW